MSFRRRALFLAGLFVAVSCSDAGNPVAPGTPEPVPGGDPESLVQMVSCTVDEVAGTMTCRPEGAGTGDALGAVNVGGGTTGSEYVVLTRTNDVSTADSAIFDVTFTNVMARQVLGTLDGTTPHPAGLRFFFYNGATASPRVDTKINPALPASVTPVADGTQVFSGAGSTPRPYFQYPAQIVEPGETSTARTWKFALDNVATWSFKGYISTEVLYPKGTLTLTPEDTTLEVGNTLTMAAHVRGTFEKLHREPIGLTWTSSNPAVVSVAELSPSDTLAQVTALAEGSAWIKAASSTAADASARRDSVLITVDNAPAAPLDSITGLTNVSVRISAERLRNGLQPGDSVVPSQTIESDNGTAVIDADRGLTYVADGGFTGLDTVRYNVTDGRWTVQRKLLVKVEPTNYWFVQAGATGDGSNTRPLGSITAAATAAGTGDTIFVLRNGSTPLAGAATLGAGQTLMGHGVLASLLLKRDALNEAGRADTVFQGQGLGSPISHTGAPALTLGSNNRVEGINITSTDAAAIHGVSFGTLTTERVMVQAGGPALSLNSGTLAGSFLTLHSQDSDSAGIVLQNVAGSLVATAGSVSGAATTAFSIAAGDVDVSFPGNITHAGSARLLEVSNHTGDATFAGTLSATAGTGIDFSGASGTYAFPGTVTLAGGDAGLDLTGSNGVFTFDDATITNPNVGHGVSVNGGTPALVYRGAVSSSTGYAVAVNGITADSVVLRAAITSGSAGSPAGLGITVQNVQGGRVVLDSIKSLHTGANPAVTLASNPGGLVRFGGSMDITTTSGAGFSASGGDTVVVTGVNTITTTTGVPVTLNNVHTGGAGLSFASVTTTGGATSGVVLNGVAGGAGLQIAGGTISGTTSHAVNLAGISAVDSVSLRGMTLSRAAGTGAVISASNFGKLHVLNTNVAATGGPAALSLSSGTLSGIFGTVSASGSTTSGVSLTSVDGTFSTTGGTIASSSAAALSLSDGSVGGTVLSALTQSAAPLLSVAAGHDGAFTFAGNVSATGGTGLQFTDADGTYNLTGSLSLAGGDAGIDIGSGSTGSVNVNPAGANTAAITSPSGTAISITGGSADLTYRGNVTQANNAILLNVTGGHNGDLSFPAGTLGATNGTGLQFDNADGTYTFGGTVTLNGGDAGIDVTNTSGGTFTFPSTATITNPANTLVSIVGSAPSFTYSGAFTKNNNSVTGILAQNNTGGSITFNGTGTKSISSGTAAAVNLASNTGTSMLFSGGGLAIASTTGSGLSATGGGTLQVTGGTNTITSAGGVALNVQNTTIGASGLSFQSISANGGANGIVLNNTGSTMGLQVTGTGTHGSGGTIVNTTGADGAVAGNGVYLEDATNVNLSWVNLSGHGNHAVRGVDVSNVTLTRVRITGTNGNNVGSDEGSVSFNNLTGTASITASYIEGGAEDNVRVVNTAGTLNRLVMNNDTIGHNGTSGNAGVLLNGYQAAVVNATVQNSRFTGSRANNIAYVINESASGDVVISGNTLTNNHPNKLGSDFGIYVAHASGGNVTYSVASNSVNNAGGAGIEVDRGAGGAGTMTGTITANTVGTAGVANSGSNAGSGIFVALVGTGTTATHNATITNNTVRQFTNYGIELLNSGTGNGYLNATVTGNNVAQPSPNSVSGQFPTSGIRATSAVSSGPPAHDGRTCLNLSGNTVTQTGTSISAEIRVQGRFGSRTALPGLSGDANTFLAGQNSISVAPGGLGAVNATSTNPFQSSCPPI